MDNLGLTAGKRPPPGTAPKPGAARGGYGDDFPAPPPDLMNQAYHQQQQRTPGISDLAVVAFNEECLVVRCHAWMWSVMISVILE